MKAVIFILFFFTTLSLTAQKNLIGQYRNYSGERIQLYQDSTFKYTWHFHMMSSWTKGIWELKGDTVYLKMVPIYDTLKKTSPNNVTTDILVLSSDETPERLPDPATTTTAVDIKSAPEIIPEIYQGDNNIATFSLGWQNNHYPPNKLLVKKGRLYLIVNGKSLTKRVKSFGTNKKWPSWYFKSEE